MWVGPYANMTGFIRRRWRDTTYAQRKGRVRIPEKDRHLLAKDKGLRRNPPFRHVSVGLLVSAIVRK